MDSIKTRIREPSTWAALAALSAPLLAVFHVDQETAAAVTTLLGSLGVLLKERGGAK